MSQYGYGYGPQGPQPPNPFPHASSSAYNATPYQTSETVQVHRPGHENAALESYEFNRLTIPGLGLKFANNTVGWQQAWANGAHEPQPGQPQAGPMDAPAADGSDAKNEQTSQARPIAIQANDNIVEEGELSEGELEDIYETGQVENTENGQLRSGSRQHLLPGTFVGQSREVAPQSHAFHDAAGKASMPARYWDPEQVVRERSGSYSPYLSPREVHSNGQENSASDVVDTPRSDLDQVMAEQQSDLTEKTQDLSLNQAKIRAQDAILRLWPLNIRYQNYLDEGIDRQLLDGLFAELGLESTTKSITEQPTTTSSTRFQEHTKETRSSGNEAKASGNANDNSEQIAKPKDKSEERKDRIARLLAAKGSKATSEANVTTITAKATATPTPTAATTTKATAIAKATAAPTAPSTSVPNKTQSEKSKLIQQKMEALRKSREANANKLSPVGGSATPGMGNSLPKRPIVSCAPDDDKASGFEFSDAAVVPDQPLVTLERSDSSGAPPIPGLFLSSTPQSSPVTNQRKRPVAADLNEFSTSINFKRPFGQARESRPFLIDVSDDEDDAEMEIDSPEQRASSIHRVSPPRPASFRDYPALSDNMPNRQFSSPKTVGTPTSQNGNANGLYDLESMNKKIEDMKRKIAEAEARKKSKQSSNSTASLPQSQNQSKEGSADIPSTTQLTAVRATSSAVEAEADRQQASLPPRPIVPPSLVLAKTRGQTRQTISPIRFRAASARLPVLEAHRSEQTRQLKHLQSEVARIEREIQDSLQEELRLRAEVVASDLDQGAQDGSEPENMSTESDPEPQSADPYPADSIETTNAVLSTNEAQEGDMQALSRAEHGSLSTTDARTHGEVVMASLSQKIDETESTRHASTADPSAASARDGLAPVDVIPGVGKDVQPRDSSNSDSDPETDVAMEEAVDSSSDENDRGSADDYEPTEAGIELPSHQSPSPAKSASHSPIPPDEDAALEMSGTDLQGVAAISPIIHPISAANVNLALVSESGREMEQATKLSDTGGFKSTFAPYETPLQYFRAYRFHPKFKDSVAGGLRSLTYSNKIDVRREVCPDQFAEAVCPRGNQCEFQHFENMKAPDDQILLQLGAYGNYEGDQKQKYITGLRDLLAGYRNRKVRDFQAISEGIIEYRSQFHGDKTKILPLGSVAI